MRILNEDDNTITVFAHREGNNYSQTDEVIKLSTYGGKKWSVGCSSCLPSNIDKAREYLKAINAAFEAMDKIILDSEAKV